MRKLFEPASAPLWLREVLVSIRGALTDIWPAPLRLKDYATSELPDAAAHRQGLVYDSMSGEVKRSDGSAWTALSVAGHAHGASEITGFAEAVRDRAGETLAAGAGISVTVDDPGDTITLACTVSQYDDEAARDAVGSILAQSATIDLIYDDGAPSITAGVRDDSISYAKIQNVSAADKLLGRSTSGAGDVEEIACTAAGRSLIAAADAAAQRSALRRGCLVGKSAAETGINASAGGYFLSWDSEAYDDGGYHDNVANNSRLTTLSGETRVRVGCTIAFANVAASSQVSVAIYRNSSSAAYAGRPVFGQTSPTATIQPTMTLASGPIPVTGGTDYFQVALFCSDASIDVTTASSFWIESC